MALAHIRDNIVELSLSRKAAEDLVELLDESIQGLELPPKVDYFSLPYEERSKFSIRVATFWDAHPWTKEYTAWHIMEILKSVLQNK